MELGSGWRHAHPGFSLRYLSDHEDVVGEALALVQQEAPPLQHGRRPPHILESLERTSTRHTCRRGQSQVKGGNTPKAETVDYGAHGD